MELHSQRLHKAHLAQQGHTHGEILVYRALWDHKMAKKMDDGSRRISIGWDRMGLAAGMSWKNAKTHCLALIEKLAVEKVADHHERVGTTYRVLSYAQILERRRKAGLTHVIKNRGKVTLVNPSVKVKESATCNCTTVVNLGTMTVVNLGSVNGGQTDHPFSN
jgi:hypothetical protein